MLAITLIKTIYSLKFHAIGCKNFFICIFAMNKPDLGI